MRGGGVVDGGFVAVVLSVEFDGCGDADLSETAEHFIIEQVSKMTTITLLFSNENKERK